MPPGGLVLYLHVILWNFFHCLILKKQVLCFLSSSFFVFCPIHLGCHVDPPSTLPPLLLLFYCSALHLLLLCLKKHTLPTFHPPSLLGETEYNARIRGISESMTPQSDRHRSYSFSGLSSPHAFI